MSEKKAESRGFGGFLLGLLFLIFLWLKLNPGGNFDTPVQDWSWWWVTAPLWGPIAVALAIFAVVLVSMIFISLFGEKSND